ncbi:MAG TPA: hypothetical protein VGP07_11930 [Polyangia bacterium]
MLGVLWANRVRAQELAFGSVGHVAISAERLFGFVHTDESVSGGSASVDTISLLSNPTALIGTGYSWPRIAVDVFVSPSVSLGAAASVFNISPTGGSLSGYQFAPRVGYAGNVSPRVAIWPRGGITYEHASTNSGGGNVATQSFLALTIEAPLVILVVPRAALLIGPTLDLGLTGTVSSGGLSADQKFTDFGVQAGLLLFI